MWDRSATSLNADAAHASKLTVALVAATALFAASPRAAPARGDRDVEVIVALRAPSLAEAVASSRALANETKTSLPDAESPFATAYLQSVAAAHRALERRVAAAVPGAHLRRRYAVVFNGLAIVVPPSQVRRLEAIPGVARVYPTFRYRALVDRSVPLIGITPEFLQAPTSAGEGVKIAIVDDGIDMNHPFFDPTTFAAPQGFPRGNVKFATAKVIVARAFPPVGPRPHGAALPFDLARSRHGTVVAGIAGGNAGISAPPYGSLSGVAPRSYLGNYRVLTIPSGSSAEGNSAEILAGIEAAVRDGMTVINLSLGLPEIEPSRDVVARALDTAARVGVVAVVAAGNDFPRLGGGSIGSPASARSAIAVSAVATGRTAPAGVLAALSSAGPTPLSLRAKPDVSAPGLGVVTSLPGGGWGQADGTSVAAPHVAGAVALLRKRNPLWTPAEVASALVSTASPVHEDGGRLVQAPVTRQGGGLIDVRRAARPLVFTAPPAIAFGFVRPGTATRRSVRLSDADGGAGIWSISVEMIPAAAERVVSAPASVTVPGTVVLEARPPIGATERDLTGFVVLTRGRDRRQIPFWLRVDVPSLPRPTRVLRNPGMYRGDTTGQPARVTGYRYPDDPSGLGVASELLGPEQVFRIRLRRQVANLGVVVVSRGKGVRVEPRIVVAGNESRQTGLAALPITINPLLADFERTQRERPVAATLFPAAGTYDLVFDSPSARGGAFAFRVWLGDTSPPRLAVATRSVQRGRQLVVAAADTGAGIDPQTIIVTVNGREVPARYEHRAGRIVVDVRVVPRGRHVLRLAVSDFQESKNVAAVRGRLPNTTRIAVPFRVR